MPCDITTVTRLTATIQLSRWATTRQRGTNHQVTLTEHGARHARVALWREYGDSPTLIVLANAMRPPVQPIEA